MKTEGKFRDGLIELMNDVSLSEINVVMLCDYVHSNRQTFYYHYRDISDVIESIFLKEKIGIGKKMNDFEAINKVFVNYVNVSYRFISEVVKSYAGDKFSDFVFSFNYRHLINIEKKKKKADVNYSMIVRYISTIMAKELNFWVSTKRKEKSADLLKRIVELTGGDSLESNIKLVINNAKLGAKVAKELCELKK